MADKDLIDKFGSAMSSLGQKILFRSDLLKINNQLSQDANKLSEARNNILQELLDVSKSHLNFTKDVWSDQQREEDLVPPTPTPTDDTTPTPTDNVKDNAEEISMGGWLKGLALAPFAFRFAKGFVSGITDDLVDLTFAGIEGLAAMLRGPIDNLIVSIRSSLTWVDDLAKNGNRIASAFGRFSGFLGRVGSFIETVFTKIPGFGVFKTLLGRLAWPITLVLGAVDAVTAFMETEGNFIDKFTAGLGGLFASVVGAPLDLLKGVVAWALNSFGFENAAEFLDSFSVSDLISSLFTKVGDVINRVFGGFFDSITDIFDGVMAIFNGDIDGIGQLFGGLVDFVFAPINAAVNFVQSIFGWGDPDEPFRLSDFVMDQWESIKAWLGEVFSFLPSMEDIRQGIIELLPSWLRPESQDEERARLQAQIEEETAKITASEGGENVYWGSDEKGREDSREAILMAQERLAELDAIQNEIAGLRRGGIVTAPDTGGLAILHGTEAVIPLDSPSAAGKINAIAEGSARMTSAMINQISPTQINSGGNVSNSNNSNTTIINNTIDPYRSLDPALPR